MVGLAIAGLLLANTINIGADLGAVAAGGSLISGNRVPAIWLVAPVALVIVGLQWYATYTTIFNIFKWLTVALFAYVVTAFFVHPVLLDVVRGTIVPHLELSRDFVTALVAVLSDHDFAVSWQARQSLKYLFSRDLGYSDSAWLAYLTGPRSGSPRSARPSPARVPGRARPPGWRRSGRWTAPRRGRCRRG